MTIINQYIQGGPCLNGAIAIAVIMLSAICFFIYFGTKHDELKYAFISSVVTAIFCFGAIWFLMYDDSRPRIEALLDDTISYVEIENKYEFIKKHGSLYIFDVKKDTEEYNKLMTELKEQKN